MEPHERKGLRSALEAGVFAQCRDARHHDVTNVEVERQADPGGSEIFGPLQQCNLRYVGRTQDADHAVLLDHD
jgi:hypothetical protein